MIYQSCLLLILFNITFKNITNLLTAIIVVEFMNSNELIGKIICLLGCKIHGELVLICSNC